MHYNTEINKNKMDIDQFFEVFTGGNSNVATWTPIAIKEFAECYHKHQLSTNSIHITYVINRLKFELQVKAGKLAEPILKQGKQPKENKECCEIFLMLAHLSEIENYVRLNNKINKQNK